MLTPFTGIRSFMKAPLAPTERSRFTIVGAPTDMAVTFRTGARMGPAAIREASLMLCDGDHPWYENDPVGQGLVWDMGDIDPVVNDPEGTRISITTMLEDAYLQHPVVLGGDHSITLACLRAAHAQHGKLNLVHFDAHVDTWETDNGVGNHGTFLREAIDEGLVNPQGTVQIGIRSPMPASLRQWGMRQGITAFTARSVHGHGNLGSLGRALAYQIQTINGPNPQNTPTYLTFDIDCLDPCVAPGTGTPEPGGLFMHQVMELMDGLSGLNYVGMDLVEVLPAHDPTGITAIAAANIVWNHICQQASKS
jgi:agmatinase